MSGTTAYPCSFSNGIVQQYMYQGHSQRCKGQPAMLHDSVTCTRSLRLTTLRNAVRPRHWFQGTNELEHNFISVLDQLYWLTYVEFRLGDFLTSFCKKWSLRAASTCDVRSAEHTMLLKSRRQTVKVMHHYCSACDAPNVWPLRMERHTVHKSTKLVVGQHGLTSTLIHLTSLAHI